MSSVVTETPATTSIIARTSLSRKLRTGIPEAPYQIRGERTGRSVKDCPRPSHDRKWRTGDWRQGTEFRLVRPEKVCERSKCGTDYGPGWERWLSGLKRTPGKREWAYTPPGVRISLSPPTSFSPDGGRVLHGCRH